ncbi:S26 family signal peptidase [Aquimarina macrocephali]|uniref:S26 family signal peptidase n=1 Tax=Aquimarina macrocephali TaxID=666563 RepID=UPI000466A3B5
MYIKKRYLNYLIKGVTLFFCLILFKVFIADIYYIPTGSMKNTIEAKSYAIASKIHYGAILPRTTHEIPYLSKIFKSSTL